MKYFNKTKVGEPFNIMLMNAICMYNYYFIRKNNETLRYFDCKTFFFEQILHLKTDLIHKLSIKYTLLNSKDKNLNFMLFNFSIFKTK